MGVEDFNLQLAGRDHLRDTTGDSNELWKYKLEKYCDRLGCCNVWVVSRKRRVNYGVAERVSQVCVSYGSDVLYILFILLYCACVRACVCV